MNYSLVPRFDIILIKIKKEKGIRRNIIMNKNFILKSGFILPVILPISLISMQIKSNVLSTDKLFKLQQYNDDMYTVEEIRKLLNE